MKRLILLIILLVVVYFFTFNCSSDFNNKIPYFTNPLSFDKKEPSIEEEITYDVILGNFCLGTSVFKSLPKTNFNGKTTNLATFETKLMNFNDSEIIYSDVKTNLPLRVERFISSWLNSEKIVEDYDQENFILTIKKFKDAKEELITIKKGGVINNAVLLPFYVRNLIIFNEGAELNVELPNQEFKVKLMNKEEINVPAGNFVAYRFESMPKNFEIWISADERKIPIKIKKIDGLGYTLVMKEYLALQ